MLAFAILLFFENFPETVLLNNIESIIRHLVPELKLELEKISTIHKTPTGIGFKREVFSARKAELRAK